MTALNPQTHTVTLDVTDPDAYFALTEALREWSWRQQGEARDELADDPEDTTAAARLRWADHADAMLDRIDAGDGATPGLPADTRELLRLIRDMLTVPRATDPDDRSEREHLLRGHLARVVGTLNALVGVDHPNIAAAVRVLREDLAAHPVSYATRDESNGEGR